MELKDKIALVTGGGSGIGAAICRAFAEAGAAVAVTDLKQEAAAEVASEIQQSGGTAESWELDVSDREAVESAADQAETELGPICIWVNNAGISRIVPFLECSDDTWDTTLRVNLTGTFYGCQAAIRRMLARGQGSILNMSSQSGKVGNSRYTAYCASKFGIIGLTQSLAVEFADKGIRVNALCPGVVFTPLWDTMLEDYAQKRGLRPEEVKPYLESKVPIGRLCEPEDVAKAAVYLASDEAAYVTGQAWNISGGAVMH